VTSVDELVRAARAGSLRAAGRLLSMAEGDRRAEVTAALPPAAIRVVGVTGPPGAGKSTTVAALIGAYLERGMRVAVLAVDPSSPYSGGALLGDRIRMAAYATEPGVLIRSLAARGHLGGLAAAVPAAVRVLAALAYDLVLLETVGVGQSEIEVAAVADPAVVVLAPGAGDAVQAAKAGLLEVADLLVVNKADRDGAEATARELRRETGGPVHLVSAADGRGVPALVEAVEAHRRSDTPARRAARAHADPRLRADRAARASGPRPPRRRRRGGPSGRVRGGRDPARPPGLSGRQSCADVRVVRRTPWSRSPRSPRR